VICHALIAEDKVKDISSVATIGQHMGRALIKE
jgi:hypothetical protein